MCLKKTSEVRKQKAILTTHDRITTARIKLDCCQVKCFRSIVARGEKANVPKPEPQTAIPVASDLLVSK